MKNLNQDYNFIKSLKQYIREGLRLSIDDSPETLQPKSWDELRQIIEERYEELGPGTKQNPINLNDIDVSEIDDFSNVFRESKFEYIDVSEWDTSNGVQMSYMFSESNIKEIIGIENFDTHKVNIMNHVFYRCKSLEKIDLSNWDVSKVTNIKAMFNHCENIEYINLKDWNTESFVDAIFMFEDCGKLKTIDGINNWNTKNLQYIQSLFKGCKNLRGINLNNWNTSNLNSHSCINVFVICDNSIIPEWYKEMKRK